MDARDWDERYAASELVWSATANQFVIGELGGLRAGRALDAAAGEGRNSLWLAENGWSVTAVDFSLAGLDKGRTLQARHPQGRDLHIDWVHADVLGYRPGSATFDLVLMAYLQLATEQRGAVVRRTFAMLEVGGTYLVVAHDSSNLTEGTGGPQDPEVLYTAEDILADLDGERFEVVVAERRPRTVADGHGSEPHRVAFDCVVRLVRTG